MSIDKELKKKYDEVYQDEAEFWTFLPVEERIAMIQNLDLRGAHVLDVGCGSGDFAAWMATAGALQVVAVDASNTAITRAIEKYNIRNLIFWCGEIGVGVWAQPADKYDVITMVGVLEHTTYPAEVIRILGTEFLAPGGTLATSSPYFVNPRGAIWLTLQTLFDAPMSLTDKHMIGKEQIQMWGNVAGLELIKTVHVDQSWGCGRDMLTDYRQRLPKVFPDKKEEINRLLGLLEREINQQPNNLLPGYGANKVYFLRK